MDPLTRSERNKNWCKNYREKKNTSKEYRKRETERKRMAKMTAKLTKTLVYELKKKRRTGKVKNLLTKEKIRPNKYEAN